MIYDIQKAGLMKRFFAWLLDLILLLVVVTGLSGVISAIVGYDSYNAQLDEHYARYEEEYGVTFDITLEEYEKMTDAQKENYNTAYDALVADQDVLYVYNVLINLTLLIVTLSILAGFLILEFVVPICLKNGQTVGKKVFGIGVMRTSGIKMNHVSLFIRTVLGKFTIETMLPVLVFIMLMFNVVGMGGTVLLLVLLAVELIMMIVTRNNSMIHDKLADTVAVDLATQMIFENEQDLLDYKKKVSAEEAAKQSYF